MAWCFTFLVFSFRNPIPWELTGEKSLSEAITSDEYFTDTFLNKSDGLFDIDGYQPWIVMSLVAVSLMNFLIIYKGIDTSKYSVYLTVLLPYFLIAIFFIKGMTLEGNTIGWSFLFKPDWSKLFTRQIWTDAIGQTIFSAGLGHNAILKLSTHRKEDDKILSSSIFVPIINFITSIVSAFALFSFVGYASKKTGISIDEMPVEGMELVFVVYPAIVSSLPYSRIWSILFFTMMVSLGLCTQYALLECISKLIYGTCKYRRGFNYHPTTVTAVLCFIIFLIDITLFASSAGYYWVEIVDHNSTAVNLPIFLFFQIIFYAYLLPLENLAVKVEAHGEKFPRIYSIFLKVVCPIFSLFLIVMIVYNEIAKLGEVSKPLSEKLLGYAILATPYSLFFIIALWNPVRSIQNDQAELENREELLNQSS